MYYRNHYSRKDYYHDCLGEGYLSRPDGQYNYPNNAAALAAAMGFANAPGSMYSFRESSGDALDLTASNDLTPQAGVTQGVSDSAIADSTVYNLAGATNGYCQASANTVFDVTTGAFAFVVVRRETHGSAVTMPLFYKQVTLASSDGYLLRGLSGDVVNWHVNGASSTTSLSTASSTGVQVGGSPYVALVGFDDNSGNAFVHVRIDGTSYSNSGAHTGGTLTNTATFRMGNVIGSAAASRIALAGVWTGTTARGLDDATHVENLAASIGLE